MLTEKIRKDASDKKVSDLFKSLCFTDDAYLIVGPKGQSADIISLRECQDNFRAYELFVLV